MPRKSGNCVLCGVWRRSLHRDHIIPSFKGGPNTPDNIQLICANCHEDKTREDLRGRISPNRGRKMSDEARAKMRVAALGRPGYNYWKGKTFSPEHRARISAGLRGTKRPGQRGSPCPDGCTCGRHQGKTYNLEPSYEGPSGFTGRSHTDATRSHMSEAHRGTKASDETRAKIAEGQRRRWAREREVSQ